MAKTTRRKPSETKPTQGYGESQHSHIEYGSTRANWDRGAATDFAITTVNVPDRLDTQEVRARAERDSGTPSVGRFRQIDLRRLAIGLLGLGLLGALAWGAASLLLPLREAISPRGVEAHLGRALGVPVSVRDTDLRFLPSPRLVVTEITGQSGFRLPGIEVHFNWRDAVQGLQSATWVLGEARIAPVKLSGAEAMAVLQSLRGASRLPAAVSTVRFEAIEFSDLALLPGRYEAVIRRGVGQRDFDAVSLKRLDGASQFELDITPPTASGAAKFALFARDWKAEAGPAIAWREATAQGEFTADSLRIDSYSVGSKFGNLNGAARVNWDGRAWRLTGNLRGPDINVEELIRFVALPTTGGDAESRTGQVPLRGTARFDLALSGGAPTLAETLQKATATGALTVAGASLHGVNLGMAATHGDLGGAGSMTRFTEFEGEVFVTQAGVAVRSLAARAGSLRVTGGFSVDRRLQLSGALRSEVVSPRGVAAAQVRVGGTAAAATFQ